MNMTSFNEDNDPRNPQSYVNKRRNLLRFIEQFLDYIGILESVKKFNENLNAVVNTTAARKQPIAVGQQHENPVQQRVVTAPVSSVDLLSQIAQAMEKLLSVTAQEAMNFIQRAHDEGKIDEAHQQAAQTAVTNTYTDTLFDDTVEFVTHNYANNKKLQPSPSAPPQDNDDDQIEFHLKTQKKQIHEAYKENNPVDTFLRSLEFTVSRRFLECMRTYLSQESLKPDQVFFLLQSFTHNHNKYTTSLLKEYLALVKVGNNNPFNSFAKFPFVWEINHLGSFKEQEKRTNESNFAAKLNRI